MDGAGLGDGLPIADPPWTEWASPSVVSQFAASAGSMTFGALITLALGAQLRHHLSGLASLAYIEGMVCASLAVLPLLALRKQFKSLSTPPVQMVHLCPDRECVAFLKEHADADRCPRPDCRADRYDRRRTPLHVHTPPPPPTHPPQPPSPLSPPPLPHTHTRTHTGC